MITVSKYFSLFASTTASYTEFAKREGISYPTLAVFEHLYNNEDTTAKDISDVWGVPKQTLHSTLRELSKKDLIIFEENPLDRRSKLLVFTEEGRKMAHPIIEKLNRIEAKALLILSEHEKEVLMDLTKRFAENLTKEVTNG